MLIINGSPSYIIVNGEFPSGGGSAVKFLDRCVLTVTGNVNANVTILTNGDSANITKTDASVSLGASVAVFNGNTVMCDYNGVAQINGVDIIYVTEYSFRMPDTALYAGDKIIIFK